MKTKILILLVLSILAAGCNPFASTLPVGIMKTVNGGTNWQFSNAIKGSTTATLAGLSISKIAFDPSSRQTLFAGSYTGGLYKSDDSGASWSNILSKIYVYDLAINPYDPKTIYAAGLFADHGRLLKTTDGGASWNQVYNEESTANAVRSIALSANNPNQLIIGLASGNVVRSPDGGQTWQLVKNFNDQVNRVLWQSNNIYVLLKAKGLFVATSSPLSFTELTSTITKQTVINYIDDNSLHAFSQVYVDLTSPNLIYITSDKGLYKTVDGGQTWSLENLPIKPSDASGHAIVISQTSSNIVFTSVGSTIYKTLDGGVSWQTQGLTTGGFVNYILIDPQLPQISYAGIYSTQ